MEFVRLRTLKDFLELRGGDTIIVKWSENYVRHHPGCAKVMLYRNIRLKRGDNEVICRVEDNHYFNYSMYARGISTAEEVYKVVGAND